MSIDKNPDTITEDVIHYAELTTFVEALDKARENSWIVVLPAPNQLQLDIDTKKSLNEFYNRKRLLSRIGYQIRDYVVKNSKSGGEHYHVTVTLVQELTHLERIILQMFLCSDPIRELLSLRRIKNGDCYATIFFEKKPDNSMDELK